MILSNVPSKDTVQFNALGKALATMQRTALFVRASQTERRPLELAKRIMNYIIEQKARQSNPPDRWIQAI